MKAKKKIDWGCLAGIFLVVFWAGAGIFGLIRYLQEKSASGAFDTMTEQSKSLCDACFSQTDEFPDLYGNSLDSFGPFSPYIHGKVLVVEAETGAAIGSTMVDLPDDLAARDPEDVGTLVCAGDAEELQYGTYTDKQPGYMLIRNFCTYDISMETVIFSARIHGSRPSPVKTTQGAHRGTDPAYNPLIEILEGLPIQ